MGGRVFWSGGEEAMNAAANYAKSTSSTILETGAIGIQNISNSVFADFLRIEI